jgi:hypothetical protein
LTKPLTVEEVSARLTGYIKPGTPPLHDADDYYQEKRRPRL